MAIERAWASIVAGAAPTIAAGRRASSVARTGAGDYTITWDEEFVANGVNYGVRAGVLDSGTGLDHIDAVAVDDDQTRVRTSRSDVLTDVNFVVEVVQASS